MQTAFRFILFILAAAGIFLAVCGPRLYEEFQKSGAGGRSTATASGKRLTAIYGLLPKNQLGFLILIQFQTPGASTSASSKWIGSATHENKARVAYTASLSDIEINGSEFDFDEGRVFFAQARVSPIEIRQLNIELRESSSSEEIDRIAKLDAIEDLAQ